MVRRGSFIGGQDNLSVPDAPTIGAATAGNTEVSVAFTAPSDVGDDPITSFGVSVFPATGTTRTFRVTVASGNLYGGGTGNVFYIDGVSNPALTLVKGFTYVFDQEDSTNSSHPLHFKDTGGSQYTTGVTVSGTAGSSGATVTLVLAEDATEPSQYYCTSHGNGMGNLITLVAPSASDDPLGQAQYTNTGSSSPITVTGLSNGTSYVAKVWAINDYGNGPLSAATSSFTPALHRGIFGGGRAASRLNTIDYVSIASTGDAVDFGDLSLSRQISPSLMSSSTRTVFGAGISDSVTYAITIDYVTIASTSNATDFGDLSVGRYNAAACSNNTRGVTFNGDQQSGTDNTIDYITLASTGNATDFGDMNITTFSGGASSSPTRGVRFGGGSSDEISYITIASTGNALDFGNLTVARYNAAGASSNTRVCMAAGEGTSKTNVIDYITTASTGNATDFGDLGYSVQGPAGTSNGTRGLFAGGEPSSGYENFIEYITIASTGNASNFGVLTVARNSMSCGSDAHGGIS